MEIDEKKVEEAVGKVFGELGVAVTGPLILLGDRLGLWAAMAGAGPVTPDQLAARTGTVERYIREWLCGVAVAGYVGYDPADGTFRLSPEMALVIAGDDSPASLIGVFAGFPGLWSDLDTVEGFFRSGGGMGWGDHHPALNDAQARFTRPMYRAALVDGWIAALDGVTARLRNGARVADIGCGVGFSTLLMAEAFPKSSFVGYDFHAPSIEQANAHAVAHGLAGRVRFETVAAKDIAERDFDLVTMFDCLHDMGDPRGASSHIRTLLKPDGVWMLVEPIAGDQPSDNVGNPVSRLYYNASTMICVPTSLDQEVGEALGAQAGEAKLTAVLTGAGFTHVRRATEGPFNMVLEARP